MRLQSAIVVSFQLSADRRRPADGGLAATPAWQRTLASPRKLRRGCGLPRRVRSKGHCRCWNCIAAVAGRRRRRRARRAREKKKREESFASGVEVEVLRDPHNPQGLSRPCVVVPEQAAHRWWLQGRGKPASCTCTHTATTALPQPSHAGVQLSKGMEEGEGHGNGTAENMHLACKTCRSGASSTSDDHSPPDVGGAL